MGELCFHLTLQKATCQVYMYVKNSSERKIPWKNLSLSYVAKEDATATNNHSPWDSFLDPENG